MLYNNKQNTTPFKCPIERERLTGDGEMEVAPKELPHMVTSFSFTLQLNKDCHSVTKISF